METAARRIYLDHAATTPLRPEVRAAMEPYLGERFGNPGSLHAEGREAREALEQARSMLRALCGAGEFDLVLCSSGTEANHLAVLGSLLAKQREALSRPSSGRHEVVASAVEHPSVLNQAELVESLGAVFSIASVDSGGRADLAAIDAALRRGASIVSLMAANNETGALEPFVEAGLLAKRAGASMHVDMVQFLGKLPIRLDDLPVDLVTVSAHKVHGPRGAAGLFVRRGTHIEATLRGGSQEGGLRAGTENVAAAVGFARAVQLAENERTETMGRLGELRDAFRREIETKFSRARVNTPREALPTILNVSFPTVEGESLVRLLDARGVATSTGSACSAGAHKPSHVLRAMGRSEREIRGSIRFSLGRGNVASDLPSAVEALGAAVRQLEAIAPASV